MTPDTLTCVHIYSNGYRMNRDRDALGALYIQLVDADHRARMD